MLERISNKHIATGLIFIGFAGCGEKAENSKEAGQKSAQASQQIAERNARIQASKAKVQKMRKQMAQKEKAEIIQKKKDCQDESRPVVHSLGKNAVEIVYPPKKAYYKSRDTEGTGWGFSGWDESGCGAVDPNERRLKYTSRTKITCLGNALDKRTVNYNLQTKHHVLRKAGTHHVPEQRSESGLRVIEREHNVSRLSEQLVTTHDIASEVASTTIPDHSWCEDGIVTRKEAEGR